MPQIVTLTLNPALDLSTHTAHVEPGPKMRCAAPQVDPGGGGVNVSRAIRTLGGKSLAVLALGGATGKRLGDLLDHEGITTCRFELGDETRSSLAVTENETGDQYRFVLPGPVWSAEQENDFLALVARLLRAGQTLVLSGSMPDGVGTDFPARLGDLGASIGARLAVDVSGPAQRALADDPHGVWLLRMDGSEARELSGRPLATAQESADFAQELVARDVAEIVAIGRGADGSVLASKRGRWHCRCDVSDVRSKVGAGDSFTAALVLAFVNGEDEAEALRHGVASASAAVLTEATELCHADDVNRLLGQAVLQPI